jgi:hypothetical protein
MRQEPESTVNFLSNVISIDKSGKKLKEDNWSTKKNTNKVAKKVEGQ